MGTVYVESIDKDPNSMRHTHHESISFVDPTEMGNITKMKYSQRYQIHKEFVIKDKWKTT